MTTALAKRALAVFMDCRDEPGNDKRFGVRNHQRCHPRAWHGDPGPRAKASVPGPWVLGL